MPTISIEQVTVGLGYKHSYLVYREDGQSADQGKILSVYPENRDSDIPHVGANIQFNGFGQYVVNRIIGNQDGGISQGPDLNLGDSIDEYKITDTLASRNSQVLYSGVDATEKWELLKQHANDIELANFTYSPLGPNCNSLPSSLLAALGSDVFEAYYKFYGATQDNSTDSFVGHNSLLSGSAGHTMKGYAGDDTFYDQGGNDTFYGGSTALLHNTAAEDGFDSVYYDYAPRTGGPVTVGVTDNLINVLSDG